ncbi:hypothetical protein FRC07_003859, partial [Ceratobasidium sp. 392]
MSAKYLSNLCRTNIWSSTYGRHVPGPSQSVLLASLDELRMLDPVKMRARPVVSPLFEF